MPGQTAPDFYPLLILAANIAVVRTFVVLFFTARGFADLRAQIESYRNFWSELFGCQLCCSHWLALLTSLITFSSAPWSWWFLPFFWLATADGTQLIYRLRHNEF